MPISPEIEASLMVAANKGEAQAQFEIAERYETADGVIRDDELAIEWYERAAIQGHTDAKSAIQRLRNDGRDVRSIRKAAEMGFASSQCTLGLMYLDGIGVKADREKAIQWLEKSAEQGFVKAKFELENIDSPRVIGNQDVNNENEQLFRAASVGSIESEEMLIKRIGELSYLEHQAKRGVQNCQFRLGKIYFDAEQKHGSLDAASHWLTEAAYHHKTLHAGAIFLLGEIQSFLKNRPQAEGLKDRAAELGWPDAQYWKAIKYFSKDDYNRQFFWTKAAAEQGHVGAMKTLAFLYSTGRGVKQDYQMEVIWVRRAIELGSIVAQYHLGFLYEIGRGVNKDETIAAAYFQKAADLGDPTAQYRLGLLYSEGRGVAKDREKAIAWLTKCAQSGEASSLPACAVSAIEQISYESRVEAEKNALKAKPMAQVKTRDSDLPAIIKSGLIHKTLRGEKVRLKSEISLVFLDFETTGLSADKGDRVIDVGAVRVSNGKIGKSFSSLVNPGVSVPEGIAKLTHISEEMLCNAPRAEKVMPDLRSFLEGSVIVAHNANFDTRFLRSEFGHVGLPDPQYDVLCTMKLAKRVVPGLPSYRLDALSSYFRLPSNDDAHRALPDARQAVALWRALASTLLSQSTLEKVSISLMLKLQDVPIKNAKYFLQQWCEE